MRFVSFGSAIGFSFQLAWHVVKYALQIFWRGSGFASRCFTGSRNLAVHSASVYVYAGILARSEINLHHLLRYWFGRVTS